MVLRQRADPVVALREERGGYTLILQPRTADASDIAYGFRRLELMAGLS